MTDYRAIFEGVESTLLRTSTLPESLFRARLSRFKQVEDKTLSDDKFYRILVDVIFYAGFRAATVKARLPTIHKYFPDYRTAAAYGEDEMERIVTDPAMLRNRRKVRGCVENARTFVQIVDEYGSLHAYLDSFSAQDSTENLLALQKDLQCRFKGIGSITSYQVLMEIGLPVLKPDRVVCRILYRLGLIEREDHRVQAIDQGREFARATGLPIRYIDIIFALYGRVYSEECGLDRGICLKDDPACGICGVRSYCTYVAQSGSRALAD